MNSYEFRRKAKLLLLVGASFQEADRIKAYAPRHKARGVTRSDGRRSSRALREASPGLVPLKSTPSPGEWRVDPFGKARMGKDRVVLTPAPAPAPGRYRLPSGSTIPKHRK